MRVYEALNSEITKISMDGGESQGRESERGSVIKTDRQAFPWHPSRSTRRQTRQTSLPLAPLSGYQETDYTKTDKPSPGTPLGIPGDRLDRQAFPWHPSRSTGRQTRQTSLPLTPLSGYQETDYRQAFPWHPSRSTRRQTRQTSLPLAPLSEYQETD